MSSNHSSFLLLALQPLSFTLFLATCFTPLLVYCPTPGWINMMCLDIQAARLITFICFRDVTQTQGKFWWKFFGYGRSAARSTILDLCYPFDNCSFQLLQFANSRTHKQCKVLRNLMNKSYSNYICPVQILHPSRISEVDSVSTKSRRCTSYAADINP